MLSPRPTVSALSAEIRSTSGSTRHTTQQLTTAQVHTQDKSQDRGGKRRDKYRVWRHVSTLYHLCVVLYYVTVDVLMFSSNTKLKHSGHRVSNMLLGGVTQLFTDWTQVIHQTYFAVSLLEDVLSYSSNPRYAAVRAWLSDFRRGIFGPVVMPATCLTVVNFWTFYVGAPDLLMADLVAFYPSVLNHAMHSYIALLVYIEMVLVPQPAVPRRRGARNAFCLMALYQNWIYLLGVVTGQWPYRFLAVMSVTQHAVFVPFMYTHGFFWYFVNDLIIRALWDKYSTENRVTHKNK